MKPHYPSLADLSSVIPLPKGAPVEHGALMPWKIVEIAKQKGRFQVSWRYRDDTLMDRCKKLHRQGWLKPIRSPAGSTTFIPGLMVELERMLK